MPRADSYGLALIAAYSLSCSGYATETQLQRVERRVERVDDRTRDDAEQFSGDISRTSDQMERVVLKQAETEQAFEAMGKGFNVLSDAVTQADEKATRVERRQEKLERTVSRKLNTDIAPPEGSDGKRVVLKGTGSDLKTGERLDTMWLTLDDPVTLMVERVSGGTTAEMPVRQSGQRLYATGQSGDAVCLDVLRRNDADEGFEASICDRAFALYTFQVAQ